jgi:polar amino acid transport system substrate-binding protein
MRKIKIMRRILTTLLIIGTVMLSYASAETYTFVSTPFPQLSEENENGELSGLAVELIQELFHNIGHEVIIKLYPRKRALQMVLDGEADGLIGPGKTVEREQIFRFGEYPFFDNTQVFYVRADDPFEWKGDYATLKGKTVGLLHGWGVPKPFEAIIPTLTVEPVATTEQNFLKLTHSRIDIILTSRHDATDLFEKSDIEAQVRRLEPPADVTPGYFVFAKNRPDLEPLILQINQELKNMIEQGRVDELQRKYGFK